MSAESGKGGFWKGWPRRLVMALVAVELLYVGAFEVAVRSGSLERWINRRPEKVAIAFASAHSWFPFWASVVGLDVRGQTPKIRWHLTADTGRGWLAPWPLVERRLRFASVHAAGIAFQMRFERPGETLDPATEALLPAIAPLAPPPATPRPVRPKWSFELPRVGAERVREVWADRLHLTGELAASGGGALHHGVEAELLPSGVDLVDGELRIGRYAIATGLRGHVDLDVARWPFKQNRGLEVLPYASAQAAIEGAATFGPFVQGELLPEWLRFDHAPGPFSARFEVRSGILQPGSVADLERTACRLGIYDFGVTGKASAHLEVSQDDHGPRGEVTVRFADFEVRQAADPRAEIVGTGLTVVGQTRDLAVHGPPFTATAHVDLGEARLANLAVYDRLVPQSLPLDIVSGSGKVQGGFDAVLPARSARGSFTAHIDEAAVRYGGLDLHGTVAVGIALSTADLATRTFDLSGTRLELTNFRIPQAEAVGPKSEAGWWTRLELPEGRLALPPVSAASGRFRVEMRDSVPLVGLFATRRDLPRWVERVLSVRDVGAEGRLGWSPDGFALEDFSTRFRKSTIRAKARFGKERKAGVMMIEWWKLALGARFDGESRQLKLVKTRDWYARQNLGTMPEVDAATVPVTDGTEVAAPTSASELAGTHWRLQETVPPSASAASLALTLQLDAAAIHLASGCGRASATYALGTDAKLEVGALDAGSLACPEPLAAEERRLRRLLRAASVVSLTPEELLLASGEGVAATELLFVRVGVP